MTTTNPKALIERGVAPRLSREIATQSTAGVGNAARLRELGVPARAAALMASAISGGSVTRRQLAELGVPGEVVRTFFSAGGGSVLLTPPAVIAQRWPSIPANFYRSSTGVYSTSFTEAGFVPAPDVTIYVNPETGNDTRDGSTPALAKKRIDLVLTSTISVAGKADADVVREIIVPPLTADRNSKTTETWNNVIPAQDTIVTVQGTNRWRHLKVPSAAAPTWTLDSGAIYATTITVMNAASVVDLAVSRTASGLYARLEPVTSKAAMAPGTWFHDGTSLFAWAADGRNLIGDQNLLPLSTGNNGRHGAVNGRRVYLRGPIDFIGGNPWYGGTTSNVDLSNQLFYAGPGVSFQIAGGVEDFGYYGTGIVILNGVVMGGGKADSFGTHSNGGPGVTRQLTLNCVWGPSGSAGPSDNAYTLHENGVGLMFNDKPRDAFTRVVGVVDDSKLWMIGCDVGQPRAGGSNSGKYCVSPAGTSEVWMDGGSIATGTYPQVGVRGVGSAFRYRNITVTRAGDAGDIGIFEPY